MLPTFLSELLGNEKKLLNDFSCLNAVLLCSLSIELLLQLTLLQSLVPQSDYFLVVSLLFRLIFLFKKGTSIYLKIV